jgi:hypothetical protein
MSSQTPTTDEPGTEGQNDWQAALEAIVEEAGYLEPLGLRHWALFVDEGPVLLVTFEKLDDLRARGPGCLPMFHDLALRNGWSHLCLIAEGETWYRDPRVWGYFDRLVDDAFFEDFDRVVFHGAGMGGYAACAFSVAAPGASVVAVAPRASLTPSVAGWDRRDKAARGRDFVSRYGYAPDMIEGAQAVFTLHDPHVDLDAMHVALFRKPWTHALRCPQLGPEPETHLREMGVLDRVIEAACRGELTPATWARLWRKRRDYGPWVRATQLRLAEQVNPLREALFLRAVLPRVTSRRLRARYQELCKTLHEEEGILLEHEAMIEA